MEAENGATYTEGSNQISMQTIFSNWTQDLLIQYTKLLKTGGLICSHLKSKALQQVKDNSTWNCKAEFRLPFQRLDIRIFLPILYNSLNKIINLDQ